jgi:DNA polymerase III subunit alpha
MNNLLSGTSSSNHFVHLRLHTEFSIQDGSIGIEKAIELAKNCSMPALAITDLNNGFAWIKFYQQALKQGIKPILGCDINVEGEQILCLAQNYQGYLNLCKIVAKAWQYGDSAYISKEDLFNISHDLHGLIILIGAPHNQLYSIIAQLKPNESIQKALDYVQFWHNILGDRLYIEIQYNNDSQHIWPIMLEISTALNVPLVATHPIQFPQQDDFQAHEIRVCISQGDTLANPNRKSLFTPQQYFKNTQEMQAIFANLPSAINNTIEIAKRCNLELSLGKAQLPNFETPNNLSLDAYLRELAQAGLEKRLQAYIKRNVNIDEQRKIEYMQRLEFEVQTIVSMGFAGYFLIVADFINWAKQQYIPVGPGRGSGAGSLVAYVLNITDIDPLPYNLLFERFLNPERVSMPDFDIDFCQHGRDKVIQYVKDKYGADAVSQIATFGTMAAKAAIRDVGRVLNLGYNFVDGIAKLIPFKPGKHVTIANALEEEPLLAQRAESEEEVKQLLELAQKLEGLARNVGMHAGGVLIAPGKLTDFCPLYSQDGISMVSQYDKDDVENVGLIKFDFLGLTTLTILDIAQKYVRKITEDENFNYEVLNLDSKNAFNILKTANTVGVFQLESRGMQSMLKDALPDCFEDIIALVSLYRPGPMDLIPSYIARKHGREQVIYPDKRVEPVLKETYGIMVYQEQVMQMAQIVGGYTLGGADLLRRAMGKKKAEEMAEHRKIFAEGALKNGVEQKKANEIFDLMEKFAGYGFNKSHATAYALLAYYTAWFKANHTACFMAANLSLAMDDSDKITILIHDCYRNKIDILPPDIHSSADMFLPFKDNDGNIKIRYGLGAIKGLGRQAIESIIQEREKNGVFTSFFNFAQRMDKKYINKRALEALVKGGAFDSLGENRGTLFANIAQALEIASQIAEQNNQISLFDMLDNAESEAPLPNLIIDDWDSQTQLKEEKSVLGFYFSGHLFDAYREKYQKLAPVLIQNKIDKVSTGKDKIIVGIVTSLRVQMTSRGKMLIINIDDGTESIECTIFNDVLERNIQLIKEDACLWVQGDIKLDHFSQNLRITAQKIYTIEQAYLQLAKTISLSINKPACSIDAQAIIDKCIYIDIIKDNTEQNNRQNNNSNLNLIPIKILYTQNVLNYSCKIILAKNYAFMLNEDAIDWLNTYHIPYELHF